MNIFDAVRELLDNRAEEYLHPDDREMLIQALDVRPVVVANISGGVLQGASSNMPVDLYTLDFEDVPLDDPENVIEVEGSEAFLGQCSTLVDLCFVREVVEAPSLADQL